MTDKPSARMLVELRRAQWRAALRGNAQLLILLGREHLGQSDSGPPPATAEEIAAELLALRDAASR